MKKFLFAFLEGLGAPLRAMKKAGYFKVKANRGFEVDKYSLQGDILKISEDTDEVLLNQETNLGEVIKYGSRA